MRLAKLAVASLWLASCAYHAGSFTFVGHEFAGTRVTFGCVDLAIDRRPDGPEGPVIAYESGNGCDQPAKLDLRSFDVIGRDADGSELALPRYDPDHEITSAMLDAKSHGQETIEYRLEGVSASLSSVCVDPSRAFGGGSPRWVCFGGTP